MSREEESQAPAPVEEDIAHSEADAMQDHITVPSLFREEAEFSEEEEEDEDDEDLDLELHQQLKEQKSNAAMDDDDEEDPGRTDATQSSDYIDAAKCIINDPWDLRSWFTLVEEAAVHDRGGTTTGTMALDRMIAQFPYSSFVWNHYITHCLKTQKYKKAKTLFDKCFFSSDNEANQIMKTSDILWLSYLRLTKVISRYIYIFLEIYV